MVAKYVLMEIASIRCGVIGINWMIFDLWVMGRWTIQSWTDRRSYVIRSYGLMDGQRSEVRGLRVEGGVWKMEDGRWKVEGHTSHTHQAKASSHKKQSIKRQTREGRVASEVTTRNIVSNRDEKL